MLLPMLLLAIAILLNGFFSSSEIAFYRANRVKLMLDARAGDFISRAMVALANRPAIFVATVLAGANVAHYLASLSMVLLAGNYFGHDNQWAEVLCSEGLTPLLFVYGDLLPKSVSTEIPNRTLRTLGWPLLACVWLLLPLTILLWGLSKLLEFFAGERPEQVRLALARKELQDVIEEGHEEGILQPAQRALAQSLFAVAEQPVTQFMIPPSRMVRVRRGMTAGEIRRIARRQRLAAIPVEDDSPQRRLLGYVRTIDLYLVKESDLPSVRTLVHVPDTESHLAALLRLEATDETLAHVVDSQGQTIGFLTVRQLTEPLFRTE